MPTRRCAITCTCRCSRVRSRVLKAMAREYTRDWYLERIAWVKAARRPISLSTDIIVGFPGRDAGRFHRDDGPSGRGAVRLRLRFQVFAAAEYAGAGDDRFHPGWREGAPACRYCSIGSGRFKGLITPGI